MTVRPAALLLVLLAPALCRAALVPLAEPDEILPFADLVVRGTVDHERSEVTIRAEWGERTGLAKIRVENLEVFGVPENPLSSEKPLAEMPVDAFLLLAVRDGRYWLVDVGHPHWLPSHSAILYVRPDGLLAGFAQPINPGGLRLCRRPESAEDFAKRVAGFMAARGKPLPRRPDLAREAADAFYALLDGHVDFYTRRVVREPRGRDLGALVRGLEAFARDRRGEARRRAIEALLILAERHGPEEPPRLAAARRALVGLLEELGAAPFVEPCLAELATRDIFAARTAAGKLLVRIGGEPLERGKAILVAHVESRDRRAASRSYGTLVSMGFEELAEEANREK